MGVLACSLSGLQREAGLVPCQLIMQWQVCSLSPLSHEDGTVRFWDASGVSLKPLYKLGTANIFQTDCEHNDSLNQAEEEWPPFRKVPRPPPSWLNVAG